MTVRPVQNQRAITSAESGNSPENTARSQSTDFFDAQAPTQAIVSEMGLLFSGTRNTARMREAHPFQTVHIPGFDGDILGNLPVLGDDSKSITQIIDRYELLRRNLIDRRNNYNHALEGSLQPDEAFDLYERIEWLDRAIVKTDQELEKAGNRKRQLEKIEGQRELEALENRDS